MTWIGELKDLSVGIAFAVVYIIGLVVVLKFVIRPLRDAVVSNTDSLRQIVENHLAHDAEMRNQMKAVVAENTKSLDRQARAFGHLTVMLDKAIQRAENKGDPADAP